jgi:hypothetical protein
MSVGKATSETVEVITKAVEKQVEVMQKSMQTAWSPVPPPNPPSGTGNPAVDAILAKYGFGQYNLPTPAGVVESDFVEDPTDDYLQETPFQRHMGAAMVGMEPLSDDNPTGIPGLKVNW